MSRRERDRNGNRRAPDPRPPAPPAAGPRVDEMHPVRGRAVAAHEQPAPSPPAAMSAVSPTPARSVEEALGQPLPPPGVTHLSSHHPK